MIVTIHQPEYLPWLGFFDKMRRTDTFVLLDTVQFSKGDFQNRNRIKTRDGWSWLSVPVFKSGRSSQPIHDVEICNDTKWGRKTWLQLEASYSKAPFFRDHREFFEDVFSRRWQKLVDLNLEVIEHLRTALEIDTQLVRASDLEADSGGRTGYLLAICQELGAHTYLSGSFGREYLDEGAFSAAGIGVEYHEFEHPEYEQIWPPFEPRMSSLDLVFNHGSKSASILAGEPTA